MPFLPEKYIPTLLQDSTGHFPATYGITLAERKSDDFGVSYGGDEYFSSFSTDYKGMQLPVSDEFEGIGEDITVSFWLFYEDTLGTVSMSFVDAFD